MTPLMLAEQGWMVYVEATEVEELQGQTVDVVALVRPAQVTLVNVPVGDIVRGASEYVAVEDTRHEVQPALVHEAHVLGIDLTLATDPFLPEVEERL